MSAARRGSWGWGSAFPPAQSSDMERSKETLERELSEAREKSKEHEKDILVLTLDIDELMQDNELLDAENRISGDGN